MTIFAFSKGLKLASKGLVTVFFFYEKWVITLDFENQWRGGDN